MKKTLFICIFSITNLTAFSQCTPDPLITSPGIYPDSATGFLDACTGIDYTQLITNVIPTDTNILVFGIPITTSIDSIVIDNVTGLPPGMSLACNPAGCSFLGGTSGCAIITGNCSVDGTYPLVFNLSAYVGGVTTPNPYIVDYYYILVSPSGCTSSTLQESVKSAFKISPNPAANYIILEGLNSKKDLYSIHLINTEGKVIDTFSVNGSDTLTIQLENIETGLYFIRINSEAGNEVIKVIKE